MPALLSVRSGTGLRVAPAPPLSSPPCSVDALERVVHFTGAGADACFYARPSSAVVAAEGLRYWLNPSVRAQPTTATCEITNLGVPFFAATSAAVLRLSASPLLSDGRCFPTRCVVSLATSAQRLDGVALRPVVLTEWSFSEAECTGVGEAAVYTTAVPLRTLFHVASLMGTTTTATEEVRLYLHLRFTGCSDASDTHRIAAVRLTYEHLGSAAEVLPVLQQRRAHAAAAAASGAAGAPAKSPAVFHCHSALVDTSALVEEVEMTTSSGSSPVTSLHDESPHTPSPPPLRRPEQLLFIPNEEVESEWSSPPRRSATKPRADASSRPFGTGLQQTPHSARQRSSSTRVSSDEDNRKTPEEDGTALVRVERTLRLPPPPPPSSSSSSSSASHRRDIPAKCPPPVLSGGGAPWPPRKTRTIVLAPSISPSLTSSSASSSPTSSAFGSGSPLSSPASTCGSTPLCHHSATCAAASVTTPESPLTHGVAAVQLQSSHPVGVHERRSSSEGGVMVGPLFSPPQRQRSETADRATPLAAATTATAASQTSPVGDFEGRPLQDDAPRAGSVQPCADSPTATTSTAAILWEATTLLGTVPWKLQSLQMSRRSSPAPSARGSRASSRERSHDATTHEAVGEAPVSAVGGASATFLPIPAWEAPRVQRREQQPLTAQEHSSPITTAAAASELSRSLWWRADDASASIVAPQNGSTVSSFASWRRGTGFNEGSTRVSPQLQPPRSAAAVSSTVFPYGASSLPASVTSTSATNPPSAYVPRLSFCGTTATRAEVNQHARDGAGIGREGGPTLAARHTSTLQQPPPSQNRDLWTRPTKDGSRKTHVVIAEHEQPLWARKSVSTASAAATATTSRHAPSAALPTAPDTQVRSGPISVIPRTWLEQQQWHQPSHDGQQRAVGRDPARSNGHTNAPPAFPAKRTTSPPSLENGAASSTASSPDDVSLVKYSTDAVPAPPPPPPPPTAPPPRSRVLFHSRASSPASSRSDSPAPPLPALPLQEAHHQQHHPQQKRIGRSRVAVGERRRVDQRRSRSAPVLRSVRPATPVEHRSAAAVAPAVSTGDVHAFSVVKHHASRSGVGRRRLLIRPVPSQDPAGVRVIVALEKVRTGSHLREALGLGGGSSSGGGGTSCEIPIRQSDVVEVWTGVQALQSGVLHREKVRSAECCVVVRCNRQLVTAVEMESAEAVDVVSHLLLPKR